MTMAARFLSLWNAPERTIKAKTLALRIDPGFTWKGGPPIIYYKFSDGSAVCSPGNGHYFAIRSEDADET